jgi:hypothetical protein
MEQKTSIELSMLHGQLNCDVSHGHGACTMSNVLLGSLFCCQSSFFFFLMFELIIMDSNDETVGLEEVDDLDMALNPDEVVMIVKYGSETLDVTRRAKNSMKTAIKVNANQPTIYLRCHHSVKAVVVEILGYNMLQYTMPQTATNIAAFNWSNVIPGQKETYLKGESPTPDKFAKVQGVHSQVKKEKGEEARAMHMPKSGVQSYTTYKQRWQFWRDIFALYRHMNPTMPLQTVPIAVLN